MGGLVLLYSWKFADHLQSIYIQYVCGDKKLLVHVVIVTGIEHAHMTGITTKHKINAFQLHVSVHICSLSSDLHSLHLSRGHLFL